MESGDVANTIRSMEKYVEGVQKHWLLTLAG